MKRPMRRYLAQRLGIDRSELLRQALRRHLVRLASENDAVTWAEHPLDPGEQALADIADWPCRGLVGLGECNEVKSGLQRHREATVRC